MFFFLSKTLNYLTQPLVIVCLLLVASWIVRKPVLKKWFFRSGIILLLLFSNEFIATELMRLWEPPVTPIDRIKKQYQYGIVLTGVTKAQVGPPDRVYFSRGADRATHALQLYKLGILKGIIVSGGSGRLINIGEREADEIASFLAMAGVKSEHLIIENQSANTHDSAVEVKKILADSINSKDCLLITSGYHIPRSIACFRKQGLDMDTFAVDPLAHERLFTFDVLFIPKMDAYGIWHHLMKESIGMAAYWMAGYI